MAACLRIKAEERHAAEYIAKTAAPFPVAAQDAGARKFAAGDAVPCAEMRAVSAGVLIMFGIKRGCGNE